MNYQANYNQLVLNLARLVVDLAIQHNFYTRQQGEIAHLKQNPDFVSRFRQFQPPLSQLEKTLAQEKVEARQAAEALQGILSQVSKFLEP